MGRATMWQGAALDDWSIRLVGAVLYAAIVGATWLLLPKALPFVVPAAALGVVLHAGMRRPWLGLAGFCLLSVVVPAVVFPSMLLDVLPGTRDGR